MSAPMNRLGLEMLTLLGMHPVDHVRLAADLGCASVSLGMASLDLAAFGYPPLGLYDPWSLDDIGTRRELQAAIADTGIRIALAEGFIVRPDKDVSDHAAALDVMADLGAQQVNAISIDPDMPRTYDQLAALAPMVHARGMRFMVEFAPTNTISTLSMALAAADHVGPDLCAVMFDAMHLFRSGGSLDDIRALPPGRLGYVQLCDVPLASPGGRYMDEAIFGRLAPGEGELPLREILELLPPDFDIGVEVPNLAALRTSGTPRAHAERVIRAARELGF